MESNFLEVRHYRYFVDSRLIVGIGLFLVLSCKSRNKCDIRYTDSQHFYCVEVDDEKSLLNKLEKGRFIFYQPNDSATEAGFYVDGFRNETWFYFTPDSIKQIRWSHYLDNKLNFETNLFARADSILYGDFFTKFKFGNDLDTLDLTVVINGPFKDSTPEKRYKEVTINELRSIGMDVIRFNQKRLSDGNSHLITNEIIVKNNQTSEKVYYLKNAFGFIGKTFIEITVRSRQKNDFYRDVLFNGVLSNFYVNKQRFYFPFLIKKGK